MIGEVFGLVRSVTQSGEKPVIPMPIVDTHNHFWRIDTDELYWLDQYADPIFLRDYLPMDLKPHMDATGVDKSVIVQASHSWADQLAYLEMAEAHDFIAGVIAWVDLEADDVGDKIDELAESPWFRGIRAGAEDHPENDAWLALDTVRRGIRTVLERGHVVELLVKSAHLPCVPQIARENEGGRLIVDHLAKPPLETPAMSTWLDGMLALQPYSHVRLKISGLLVECPNLPITDVIQAAVDPVLEAFPIERLIWGSDWPVALLAASYEETFKRVTATIDRLSKTDRSAVLGGNAMTFYELS